MAAEEPAPGAASGSTVADAQPGQRRRELVVRFQNILQGTRLEGPHSVDPDWDVQAELRYALAGSG